MELIDISVQDGRGLIKVAISGIHDRVRIQDYFREAEKLFFARDCAEESFSGLVRLIEAAMAADHEAGGQMMTDLPAPGAEKAAMLEAQEAKAALINGIRSALGLGHNVKVTGSPDLSASPRGLPGYTAETTE